MKIAIALESPIRDFNLLCGFRYIHRDPNHFGLQVRILPVAVSAAMEPIHTEDAYIDYRNRTLISYPFSQFTLPQFRFSQISHILIWSSDGWAKNQLGERRLGELFFGRQTIGRQARTVQRQQIGRLGDIVQTVGQNV